MGIKNIVVSESLVSSRHKLIKKMLAPVASNTHMQAVRIPGTSQNIVFCFTDNKITNYGQFVTLDVRETFKTNNPKFLASYFEIWNRIDKKNFVLNKMYFHLFEVEDRELKEYILLHTDPLDDDLTHGDYKRSPHIHIKKTDDNRISHAHLALNMSNYNEALSSINEIDRCFSSHIEMLAAQILL